ncbi:immunity protein Imm33 domain-containing protein [Undibacterium sp. JH2W]|uniref:immunity protein Imm33 domain-containing protein n=1 Tax=Undibacterium sp. JH2W TaxID=3413037 RepID=UPI003BF39E67
MDRPARSIKDFQDNRNCVDVSLNVIAKQNKFANGIGAKQVPITFQNKVIMAKGVLDESSLYMERIAPDLEKNDSGWYIGKTNLNEGKDELSAIYAFQLLQLRPELIDVLTIPEGYMVFVNGLTVSYVTNPNDEVVFS